MTCNRVVIINEGEIVAVDSVENLERASSGKSCWNIVIKPENIEKGAEIFALFPEKSIFEQSQEGEVFRFRLELPSAKDFDRVFAEVSAKGVVFREITPVRASLEEVFIKLTGGEERKQAA